MSIPGLDDLLAGGGKSAKFENPGDSITGKVIAVETRQVTDINTNEPKTWDDGSPQLQAVITLETALRDPEIEGDDGKRNVYIKMWGDQRKALQQAAREAGASPAVGDTFSATFTAHGPVKKKGFSAPKLFVYKIVKGSPLDAHLATSAPAAPAQAKQEDPWATPGQAAAAGVGTLTPQQEAQVQSLIATALTDEQIAQALSLPAPQVAAARFALAGATGKGF